MEFKFKSLADLLLTFNTEQKCREYLEFQLWEGKPTCPHCEHTKAYKLKDGKTYKCAGCHKKYTVTVGTFMENSKIPLQKWFMALFLFTTHKRGVSSCQLARDLGISQKSAWYMLQKIRTAMKEMEPVQLEGHVEVDETYIGGKTKNMHGWKRQMVYAAGSSGVHLNPVLGMIERGGRLRLITIPEPNGRVIKPQIFENVSQSATLITDGHGSYSGLNKFYDHHIVEHDKGEYVREQVYTNNIECAWGHLKRMITGTYYWVSGKHLSRYCDEFAFRYNTRTLTDAQRFEALISRVNRKLTYKQIVHG